jgi:hypothetical protein
MKRILPFIIILVVLGAALGSAWYLTRTIPASPAPVQTAQAPSSQTTPAQQPVANKGVPGSDPAHTLGPANAPVQLEEFGDFQCPPCGMFHPILEQMHEEFGDRMRITFREYPLPNHQHALAAASAAEAAGIQGKFWEMHDLLYEHQNDWKEQFDVRPIFEGYAKQAGVDVERYNFPGWQARALARRPGHSHRLYEWPRSAVRRLAAGQTSPRDPEGTPGSRQK